MIATPTDNFVESPRCLTFIGDPVGFVAGDANLYRYVGNDPVNSIDPTGLEEVGQHWISRAEFGSRLNKISKEALGIFRNYTTPTGFSFHGNDTFFFGNTITTHLQYNEAIGEVLDAYGYIDDKAAREIVGFIQDERQLLKNYKRLGISLNSVQTISRYKQGFLESIDIATAIKSRFPGKNFGKNNINLKRLSQILGAGENPSDEVLKAVQEIKGRMSSTG